MMTLPAVASDLVLVVSKASPVESLTKSEVIDIYMGRFLTFPDGSEAQPIDLESDSGFKNQFYMSLVNQNERKINAYWSRLLFSGRAKPPRKVETVEEALNYLSEQNSRIVYIPESALTEAVKVVFRFTNK
jgi:hypothetical protein